MSKTKQTVTIALLISLGLVLHLVENFFPLSAIVPGAKLGLANIVSMLAIVLLNFPAAFQIIIFRVILASLIAGTFMTINFYLSLSGALLSFFLMYLTYRLGRNKFSLIGISIIGAAAHNTAQIITAAFIISNSGIFYYLPFLLLLSLPTGLGVGLVSYFTLKHLPSSFRG
ncbi:Gx transporter family protein [Halanaerobium salsuginis]|jgi:heptaprenyl diphosphate synthase|uniref:Heptaprenyl diphosphate synthase n=1 Tax=Halanaerobium salsuginis TaxID=29563 RepID=A0A1I4HNY5_9FIRM|nr:Gx transporter family protein [Halanaerobium salsuginis]SFL43949.1 heptaprenyl diphosphate synthase [Halanaerobium salsuginis]